MQICISKLTIIGSDNGLSPGRRQAISWTNAGILLIQTLGTNFSEISTEIQKFYLKKMHWKIASGKWRPFCLGLNVLTGRCLITSLALSNQPPLLATVLPLPCLAIDQVYTKASIYNMDKYSHSM